MQCVSKDYCVSSTLSPRYILCTLAITEALHFITSFNLHECLNQSLNLFIAIILFNLEFGLLCSTRNVNDFNSKF